MNRSYGPVYTPAPRSGYNRGMSDQTINSRTAILIFVVCPWTLIAVLTWLTWPKVLHMAGDVVAF